MTIIKNTNKSLEKKHVTNTKIFLKKKKKKSAGTIVNVIKAKVT